MRAPGASFPDGEVLATLALCAPVVAQLVMLIAMVVERRWLFAIMIAPGLIGCAASAMLSALRSGPSARRSDAAASSCGSSGKTAEDSAEGDFDGLECPCWEILADCDPADPLLWRDIVRRWLSPLDLEAPVGVAKDGPFRLDLLGRGPHALVAGTTGSGKSVLLQTWCLALACLNSPEQLNFVFLDFKGGSAFNRLERLPHTVGCVCDLDLSHAVRALEALESEIRSRERLMSGQLVSDVRQMEDPPPRLMIVVDEFHALRSQLPDYVDRLVRVAALGRSLGMHLIACTQNPLGQVSADMKANIALNICLRVRDPMQSAELLGTPAASVIAPSLPGAAYCHDGESPTPMRCAPIRDIDALMDQISLAQRFCGLPHAAPLFSAPLPRTILRAAFRPSMNDMAQATFALGDDGTRLHPVSVSLSQGNIAIIGPSGRGRTTLLSVFADLAGDVTPLQARWTCRDTGGMATRNIHHRTTAEPSGASRPPTSAGPPDPPANPHLVWLVDDADPLFDPLNADPLAVSLRTALASPSSTVVFVVQTARHVRVPEHCTTRIVFPTGDRTIDMMSGIPSEILDRFTHEDIDTPGRAVLLDRGQATPIQCFS